VAHAVREHGLGALLDGDLERVEALVDQVAGGDEGVAGPHGLAELSVEAREHVLAVAAAGAPLTTWRTMCP
jgi:hypothetical protein